MQGNALHRTHIAPGSPAAATVAALFVHQCDQDTSGVSIPRPEVHLVARFGSAARSGLDVHVLGVRQRVHRKPLRGGQRTVTARLQLGAHEAVLGVPVSAVVGCVVELEDLWGAADTCRLLERLHESRGMAGAAAVLESAILGRLPAACGHRASAQLAIEAARRLPSGRVAQVAAGLGVTDRHLRRVFRETLGVSPKEFARLARFRRALRAAREQEHPGWADIATGAGYYDQAHLIAEFRAIAGVTPGAFLSELYTVV